MGSVVAGNGARGHASESPRSAQIQTAYTQGPKRGVSAMRTADANPKRTDRKPLGSPQHPTQEGREGSRDGSGGGGGQGNGTCNACLVTHTSTAHRTRIIWIAPTRCKRIRKQPKGKSQPPSENVGSHAVDCRLWARPPSNFPPQGAGYLRLERPPWSIHRPMGPDFSRPHKRSPSPARTSRAAPSSTRSPPASVYQQSTFPRHQNADARPPRYPGGGTPRNGGPSSLKRAGPEERQAARRPCSPPRPGPSTPYHLQRLRQQGIPLSPSNPQPSPS